MRYDAETLRRFAKRIDGALDVAARGGALNRSSRFCISDQGKFFVTINPDQKRWGVLSVGVSDLEIERSGRFMYTWLEWPRSLRRVLSREPSLAARDIANALIKQGRGHAGVYPARYVPTSGGLVDARAPSGTAAWWSTEQFEPQYHRYLVKLSEPLADCVESLGAGATARMCITSDDMESFAIQNHRATARYCVWITECLDLSAWTLWRRSLGFTRSEAVHPYSIFYTADQYDFVPGNDVGTYAICALEAQRSR